MSSGEDAFSDVSWMASPVGNNSTEFQISEYISLTLSFLGMRSTPGVFIYSIHGFEKTDSKILKIISKGKWF